MAPRLSLCRTVLVLALGLAANPLRVFAQDYGKLNACAMFDDGRDATGEVNSMTNAMWPYKHPELNVYASMRAIQSMDGSAGCDAIIVITCETGFTSSADKVHIVSGLSKRTLYQGPSEGWNGNSSDLEAAMAGELRPGGATYNAIVAERTADCQGGASRSTPFCQTAAQKAQQEEQAKAAAAQTAAQAAAAQEAQQASSMEESIREKIPEWLALKKKPSMPPEAHRYKVLAEDAVHEKRFADAV
ncbi:MAG TPA: hypothetical protein VN915_14320, partial [Elusimicrobiota bacterium]|nr:hypothetical protein [Elusimicrobiota bacterium]